KDHLKMTVVNSIASFKLSILERDIKDLQQTLKSAPEEDIMETLKAIAKKENIKKIISSQLGRTVLR
ncbi:MAG: hypothetical protein KAH25_10390, partial [Bacteroidales bacterium]|nr:hypothetical protein [Bacteroidales bacterium]